MRGFFERSSGRLTRLLVIESGPREVGEQLLTRLLDPALGIEQCDVLTCYATAPDAFDSTRGALLSVHSPEATSQRGAFVDRLAAHPYDAILLLCPGSGVLAKWKWAIAAKTKTRLVIADEFGDWFFVNYTNLTPMAVLAARRMRLQSVPLLLLAALKILLIPFVIGFLALYAVGVHARRWLRMRGAAAS